jgi:hypothetical protein
MKKCIISGIESEDDSKFTQTEDGKDILFSEYLKLQRYLKSGLFSSTQALGYINSYKAYKQVLTNFITTVIMYCKANKIDIDEEMGELDKLEIQVSIRHYGQHNEVLSKEDHISIINEHLWNKYIEGLNGTVIDIDRNLVTKYLSEYTEKYTRYWKDL